MIEIQLTQGKVALIDDADFPLIGLCKWYVNRGYAQTSFYLGKIDGRYKYKKISMHNVIMGTKGIDHRDGNGLNNQRSNLRPATPRQNNHNLRKKLGTSSQYKGVYWHKRDKKWMARVKDNGRTYYLGHFVNEQDAARAYDAAAISRFGEFANLNFPAATATNPS